MLVSFKALLSLLFLSSTVSCSLHGLRHGHGGRRQRTCVIPSQYKASNGTADDSPAVAEAFAKCSVNAVIEFSEGVDYNILQPVSAKNLSNVAISVLGNLHLPQNITAVQ